MPGVGWRFPVVGICRHGAGWHRALIENDDMMTPEKINEIREAVLDAYDVDGNGRIVSPGKFEGEPIFAPHFWNVALAGFADSDDGSVFTFKFGRKESATVDDFAVWPELKTWLGRSRTLRMREDDQGFVHCF